MGAGRTVETFPQLIDTARTDIWRYASLYDHLVDPRFRLTLGEGWTPQLEIPSLSRALGLDRLVFKREDLNPTGSHKARSLAYHVSKARQEGKKALIISSSGNAAVAAAAYARPAGIALYAFISPRTAGVKKDQLRRLGAVVVETDRAIGLAKYAARKYGLENLRPSSNDMSIEGFKSMGYEMYERLGEFDAIVTFVSSGSSILGIDRAFRGLAETAGARPPALYAVHAGALAGEGEIAGARSSTLAGSLGVKRTRRARQVLWAVAETGGRAVPTGDSAIESAGVELARAGILTSPEGVACFGALKELVKADGFSRAVCILTGHSSQWPVEAEGTALRVEDEAGVDRLIDETLPAG
ncbi:MAG: pyridoxal-phosphate dependent enzyme [Candidatus Aquicultorales bacterium]